MLSHSPKEIWLTCYPAIDRVTHWKRSKGSKCTQGVNPVARFCFAEGKGFVVFFLCNIFSSNNLTTICHGIHSLKTFCSQGECWCRPQRGSLSLSSKNRQVDVLHEWVNLLWTGVVPSSYEILHLGWATFLSFSSGNYFANYFIMGGERFDSPQPQAYLFGENADLNFLTGKPVSVSRKWPQVLCNSASIQSFTSRLID